MHSLSTKPRHLFRLVIPAYPTYNIYSQIAGTTTALGPLCIATVVDKMPGWDAEIIDENNFRASRFRTPDGHVDHSALQRARQADVVGLYGGLTSTIPRLYSIARSYKEMGAVTVAGGQHFNDETLEESLRSGIDYLMLGEGEEVISNLLTRIISGGPFEDIKGLVFIKDGLPLKNESSTPITDFSRFPLPDFSLVRNARISLYPVERIRGCGMECEFCTVKGKPRPSEPERFLGQISKLVETRRAKHFFIVDDLFGQQRDETIRLCRMLADYQREMRLRLGFTAQIRLDKARDPELLSAMRLAGIKTVAIGFESPIKEDLDNMNKHLRQEDMISLVKVFRDQGFFIHGMFIFGYPSEKQAPATISISERIKAYRSFVKKARLDTIQILLPVPLPGTELRRRLLEQNRVYKHSEVGWEFYDGNFPLFLPDEPYTSEQLQDSSQKIMGSFYRPKHLFLVGLNILSFSVMVFFLHDLKLGWKKWYRQWRNSLCRTGGYFTLKNWRSDFKKNGFTLKLQRAKQMITGKQVNITGTDHR